MTRFYIYSCNECLRFEDFDSKINLAQLGRVIGDLMECYLKVGKMLKQVYSEDLRLKGELASKSSNQISEMIEEVVFVSPNESKFISVNIVIQYFENSASFYTNLSLFSKSHPLVVKSEVFRQTMSLISCLEKGHIETFFKKLEASSSVLIKSTFCFPEILNTVRLKYMQNLRILNNPDAVPQSNYRAFGSAASNSSWAFEPSRAIGLDELKSYLRIQEDDNIKTFLALFYGKKMKGVMLWDLDSRTVFLD